MSDFHDFVQLPAEGQSTPTNYVTPGALTTVTSTLIGTPGVAQITTQVNASAGGGLQSVVTAQEQVAVIGPVYYSPGNVNRVGPANSNLTTGGGP